MKSNELRIGNYLSYKLGTFIVRGVGKDCVWLNDTGGPISINGFLEIQPIPLTEEWLLKFGFDKYLELRHNDFMLEYISFNKKIMLTLYDYNDNEVSIDTKIKCVHQLQNLFYALTCEELTIKEI